ncbi:FAD linked oxidase N-terminal [Penicillium odoratum]|uniref:FAD linked oxidase N-terminal n=1 Tax=Penicillium odoratum TaxID=1167516 RepID=UPI002549B148|nr:FAD linked oxidase N-terminal [Penicillium odoratum]KAJ5768716.1 FAD linked oxidase N-terminal [Penicillium odoratum]
MEIIHLGDARYEEHSNGWNTLYGHKPTSILLPRTAEEAASCLSDVIRRKEKFRIRSGGHDVNGYSAADGVVVIDLRHLDTVEISDDNTHVKVGPAVKFKKLYPALADRKLVVPAGICNDVAVGGHALGGGNGYLHRFLGASCDTVIGLKLIDCHGRLIHASSEENPDLFWALRGAGNANFGMVIEYTYRTTKVEKFSTFAITWKWDEFNEIFSSWQNWAPYTDTRLTSTFTLYKDEITAMGMFAGPKEDLQSILPNFILKPGSAEVLSIDDSVAHEHATFAAAAVMCDLLDDAALVDFEDIIRHSPGTSSIVFFARGGRICGVPSDFNAYRYRSQSLEPMFRTTWKDDYDREACLNWITSAYRRLKSHFQGVYKNWTYSKVECGMYDWYGDDIPRLVSVKRKFDPENIFSNPQSLPVYVTEQQINDWNLPKSVVDILDQQGSLAETSQCHAIN